MGTDKFGEQFRQSRLREMEAMRHKSHEFRADITVDGNVIRRNGKIIGFVRDPRKISS